LEWKGTAVREPENIQKSEAAHASSANAPVKVWHKPVLTIADANTAENGPGAVPDSGGIDFS
jgi:hypothetical protein